MSVGQPELRTFRL